MNYCYKLLFLWIVMICSSNAQAEEFIVTSSSDDGDWNTLRGALILAQNNPGADTVFIDVAGTISLQSTLNISDSNLLVVGPYAKHLSITSTSSFSGPLVQISESSNVLMRGLSFQPGTWDGPMIRVISAEGDIEINRCVFEGNTNSLNGAIEGAAPIDDAAKLRLSSCTFLNNQASSGGAVHLNGMDADIANCTFGENDAVGDWGGAIYLEANPSEVMVRQCTFRFNTASAQGQAIYVAAGGTMRLLNNIFSGNGLGDQIVDEGDLNSDGGNVYNGNTSTEDGFGFLWGALDEVGFSLPLNFLPLKTDGYGMKHYPIGPLGSAVDFGQPTPGGYDALEQDCRLAPRALATSTSGTIPDAGAFEYTPMIVNNISTGPGSLGWAMNPTNWPGSGPIYIEFMGFSVQPEISPFTDAEFTFTETVIVDGFTSPLSTIPGPAAEGVDGVNPGLMGFVVRFAGASPDAFTFSLSSANCRISGADIREFPGVGMRANGTENLIAGNLIGISENGTLFANDEGGIAVEGDSIVIGGYDHWTRNVISGNGASGPNRANILVGSNATYTKIQGNFIGIMPEGDVDGIGATTDRGIVIDGESTKVGTIGYGHRNVIGQHNVAGILHRSSGDLTTIYNNYIGVDYEGLNTVPNDDGILLEGGENIEVGGLGANRRNIISGNNQVNIRILSPVNLDIVNNWIGPDSSGNSFPGTVPFQTPYGIFINGATGGDDVDVGITASGGGNLISGCQTGIRVDGFSMDDALRIKHNAIGFQKDGVGNLGNRDYGIHLRSSLTAGIIIGGGVANTIGWTSSSTLGVGLMIEGNGAGDEHTINSNQIGLNINNDAAAPNRVGVQLNGCISLTLGADFGSGDENYISGNSGYGIEVNGGNNNTIKGNLVGLRGGGTTAQANTGGGILVHNGSTNTTIGGTVTDRNVISGNLNGAFPIAGIQCEGTGTDGSETVISANFIGLDVDGDAEIPNFHGIQVLGDHEATIGGTNPNYIAGNQTGGVRVATDAETVEVAGNVIGLNPSDVPRPNIYGVILDGPAQVGTTTLSNQIAGNSLHGILVNNGGSNSTIDNNDIGNNGSGTTGIENGQFGIAVLNSSSNLIGDPAGSGNRIGGNGTGGIHLTGGLSNSNLVQNNVFYDPSSSDNINPIGIVVSSNADNNQIGGEYDVEGNDISRCTNEGILVEASDGTIIRGNTIGNDGSTINANNIGIKINTAQGTLIGGENPSGTTDQYNVISGNDSCGILLTSATNTKVHGNMIGLEESGEGSLSNSIGIVILGVSENTEIGSSSAELGNTISGNTNYGIWNESNDVSIWGNRIGLSYLGTGIPSGTSQLVGIRCEPTANSTLIGGSLLVDGNYIANNTTAGIQLLSGNNKVHGNIIGLGTDSSAVGSQNIGIELLGTLATANLIGTSPRADSGNTIMNNEAYGIYLHDGPDWNRVRSNSIGCWDSGSNAGDQDAGIRFYGAGESNWVGDTIAGYGNIISLHDESGIQIDSTSLTTVVNNQIGSYFIGFLEAPNGVNGIDISNYATNNIIGGGIGGLSINTISSNVGQNVLIDGENTTGNDVSGNIIGLAFDSTGIATSQHGILVQNGANGNFLGKTSTGNIIGNATIAGIQIDDADDNFVQANWVGLSGACFDGVMITSGSTGNLVGGDNTQRNIISRNDNYGVGIIESDENRVLGNFIGTGLFGNDTLPNNIGIYLEDADFNRIGGLGTNQENLISSNIESNIKLSGCTGDTIQNNLIGSNSTGNDTISFSEQEHGILALNSVECIIGGDVASEGNTILDHDIAGIKLESSTNFAIHGNQVGMTNNTLGYHGNQQGIVLSDGSDNNAVGNPSPQGNRIAANYSGLVIDDSDNNLVEGNNIGTSVFGLYVLPEFKQHYGVIVRNGATGNIIGGDVSLSEGNLIGCNDSAGVVLQNVSGNAVDGNRIGINSIGFDTITNRIGVYLQSSNGNRIGAPSGRYNIISGNELSGIVLNESTGDTIHSNYIGSSVLLWDSLANSTQKVGIAVLNSSGVYIGGSREADLGNSIISQDSIGIMLDESTDCEIYGNNIGVTTLDVPMGCDSAGIYLTESSENKIGLDAVNYHNVISYNKTGIQLNESDDNVIERNLIGTGLNGDDVVEASAQDVGVLIAEGSSGNLVQAKNTISGQADEGIIIEGAGAENNEILGNYIGLDSSGAFEIPNKNGVMIRDGATDNRVGNGTGGMNVIAGNTISSVALFDAGTEGNIVSGNLIGMYADSSAVADPTQYGIGCLDGAGNNFLGEDVSGGGNRICGVDSVLVYLGIGANNNRVQNNAIGILPDASGDPDPAVVAVFLSNANNNVIGGVEEFQANEIAFVSHGIELENGSPANSILGNSIHDVGEIGIDIDGDTEIEENDSLIVVGANNVEIDRPILLDAYSCVPGENTRIGYRLTVPSGADYIMEFFISDGVLSESGDGDSLVGRDTVSVLSMGQQLNSQLDVELSDTDILTATVTQLSGATSEFSENIALGDAPDGLDEVVPITTTDSVYCPVDTVAPLMIAAENAIWYDSYPDNVIGEGDSIVPVLSPGTNWFYGSAATIVGCETPPDSISLFLSDTSLMFAIEDRFICIGSEVQLESFGGETYVWEENPDLSALDVSDPTASPSAEVTYYLTITDSLGCVKEEEVSVFYLPRDSCQLEHYTAFTPNNDGVNDLFWIDGIEGWDKATVYIYNRWGDRMRVITDYDNEGNSWDGTKSNGNLVQTGTYYFVVDVGSKDDNFAGWVQVMY